MPLMTRIRSRSQRGADAGGGGSVSRDPPRRRTLFFGTAVPAITSIALVLPVGRDGRFSPVLAWFLAAVNLAIFVGLIAAIAGGRRRRADRANSQGFTRPNS